MKLKLIEGWHNWWRFWSVRLQLVCAFLTGWLTFDPGSVLMAWNMMPETVRAVLPGGVVSKIGLVLFLLNLLSVIARVTAQKKLEKPDA